MDNAATQIENILSSANIQAVVTSFADHTCILVQPAQRWLAWQALSNERELSRGLVMGSENTNTRAPYRFGITIWHA